MKRKNSKELFKEIREAQKDKGFIRDINAFIKASTRIQKS